METCDNSGKHMVDPACGPFAASACHFPGDGDRPRVHPRQPRPPPTSITLLMALVGWLHVPRSPYGFPLPAKIPEPSMAVSGTLALAQSLIGACAAPLWGSIADTMPRRPRCHTCWVGSMSSLSCMGGPRGCTSDCCLLFKGPHRWGGHNVGHRHDASGMLHKRAAACMLHNTWMPHPHPLRLTIVPHACSPPTQPHIHMCGEHSASDIMPPCDATGPALLHRADGTAWHCMALHGTTGRPHILLALSALGIHSAPHD